MKIPKVDAVQFVSGGENASTSPASMRLMY